MERDCEECKTWEQSIYWTHFQSIHFCQILDSHFRSQLMIPRKFCDYARGKLQDKVTLKGPNGTMTFEVGLTTNGDMLYLRDGWEEFVNAFSLEQNDILIFKYNGNSCFSVLIFDRESLCEKESSYFIRNCGHWKTDERNRGKTFLKEVMEEFTQEYSHKELDHTPSKKPRKDKDGQDPISLDQPIDSDVPDMGHLKASCVDVEPGEDVPRNNQQKSLIWEPVKLPPVMEKPKPTMKVCSVNVATNASKGRQVIEEQKEAALCMARKELTGKPRKEIDGQNPIRLDQPATSDVPDMAHFKAPFVDVEADEVIPRKTQQKSCIWEPVKLPPVTEKKKPTMKVPSISVATHVSKGRPVSEEQKKAALRMARKELTSDSFLVIMRPSHVQGKFFMNIPVEWVMRHLITLKNQFVRLRTNEKTWRVKLLCQANGRAGLSLGWKEFALGNCLEEFDVCVFKLASKKHDEPIVLDVSICRVVPDAVKVPPRLVSCEATVSSRS